MKKNTFAFLSFAAAFTAFAAAPSITGTPTITQDAGRRVTVSYTLAGDEPAIVTCVFQTNFTDSAGTQWVSIGGGNHGVLMGDVSTVVEPGDRKIYWNPEKYWPDRIVPANGFRAVVKAYPTNSPPDYLVIDLEDGMKTWYEGADYLPDGGLVNDVYRTDRLVMRRIPAAFVTWTMGDINGKGGSAPATAHKVRLSSDYYMGVFELTYGQLVKVAGDYYASKNWYSNETYRAIRPASNLRYYELRGQDVGRDWPTNRPGKACHDIDARFSKGPTILHEFRTLTGLRLDLPTEAQWEYACRAGEPGDLYLPDRSLNELARYRYSGGYVEDESGNWVVPDYATSATNVGTAAVGTYAPNNWGLYDMIGNVSEWCLDRANTNSAETKAVDYVFEDGKITDDPKGGAWPDFNRRITRGENFSSVTSICNSWIRNAPSEGSGSPGAGTGCRLCWTLNAPE